MLLKNKMVWLGALVVLIVLTIFGVAMMGSILGAKPDQLPVGLVVQDKGVTLPNGSQLQAGEKLKSTLLESKELPVKWKLFDSEEEAKQQLDDAQVYGVLMLPIDLSEGVLSLASSEPKPATVQILVNEGMNTQASASVKQLLNQVMKNSSVGISKQVIQMVEQQSEMLPISTAEALLNPIFIKEEVVHPVGNNNASGTAPNMLIQIMWMGSLVASVFLFLASKKTKELGASRWSTTLLQVAMGWIIVIAASAFLVWMAASCYGMELQSAIDVWLFLCLAGTAFFFLQSALLNLMGIAAMGLLVLLLFFSMPVIGMAPEFLPETTRNLLYSWTPFRFAAEGMRSVMYFDGGTTGAVQSFTVLGWLGAISLAVMTLAGGIRKLDSRKSTSEVSNS